ncbi:MAG: AbrB/MazE/SpoVT family DNA-binding domain-containing protein [Pygmaiobacter sp.]|nr:AbrB/MazE/SpoVT family DNA-binding domain-containing protein [Pygmaiobacter sp.]
MSLKMPEDKFMSTVKVGEKGQIVIPKGARDLFGIEPGDTLLLMADKKQGIGIVPNAPFLDFAKAVFDVQKKPPQAAEEEDTENSTHTEENED